MTAQSEYAIISSGYCHIVAKQVKKPIRGLTFFVQSQDSQKTTVPQHQNPFRLNVGLFLGQPVGYTRDFPLETSSTHLDEDLKLTDVTGSARITRTAQGLLVQVKLQASSVTECSRCLNPAVQTLAPEFTELYAFTRNSVTDSGLLLPENHQIDLTPLVREYMLLDIPISPLCKPDCKGLCPVCGNNLNEYQCVHDDILIDPRLSILKNLLDKD